MFEINYDGKEFEFYDIYEALSFFSKKIQAKSDIIDSYLVRAEIYKSLNNPKAVIDDYTNIISIDPNNYGAYVSRGNYFKELGQFENALADLNSATRINPSDILSYYNRGVLYHTLERYPDAHNEYSSCIKLAPNFVQAYNLRADANTKLEKFLDAISDYTTILQLQPNNHEAYNNRGFIYFELGKFKEAINDYSMCIELDPMNASFYKNRGVAFSEVKKYDEAIRDFNRALELQPNNYEAYDLRAKCYFQQKNFNQTIKDYNRAIELEPRKAKIYFDRGLVFHFINDYEQAIHDYNLAISYDNFLAKAYSYRGVIFSYLNKFEEALGDNLKAIKLDPKEAVIFHNSGIIYSHLGKSKKAIIEYSKAIEIDKHHRISYFNRGEQYLSLEQYNFVFGDFVIYLYLSIQQEEIGGIPILIKFFEEGYPLNVKTIIDNFSISKNELILDPFENALNKLKDFSLLIFYYQINENLDERKFLSLKGILSYYLGGNVLAYKIFDEKLDTGDSFLSSQELYYYAKAAKELYLEEKSIIENSIKENRRKDYFDLYYLAHLFLLNENIGEAIEYFRQSSSYIYSKIMLIYLLENENEKRYYFDSLGKKYKEEVLLGDVVDGRYVIGNKVINASLTDITQFNKYFHYAECNEAIEFIRSNYDKELQLIDKPFWEGYYLDKKNRDIINIEINRITIIKLIASIKREFVLQLENHNIENRQEIISDLNYKLREGQTLMVTDLFGKLESRVGNDYDFENQLAKAIENWKPSEPKLYLIFMEYYYLKEEINSAQVFTLLLYLINIYLEHNYNSLEKFFMGLYYLILEPLLSLKNLGFKFLYSSMKNAQPFIQDILKDFNEFTLNEVSNYQLFKENLWKFIALEKNRLTAQQFKNRYLVFEWFDNYQFN